MNWGHKAYGKVRVHLLYTLAIELGAVAVDNHWSLQSELVALLEIRDWMLQAMENVGRLLGRALIVPCSIIACRAFR